MSDTKKNISEENKNEVRPSVGKYVHKFSKPFVFEEKTYEQLTFDFSTLTGKDAMSIENELQAKGQTVLIPEYHHGYLLAFAARACVEKIPSDAYEYMPINDYNAIRKAARNFMMGQDF